MPVCSSALSSRMGLKTSTPIISTMSSTSIPTAPSATRAAPRPSAAAAPTAMQVSVTPREAELLASTHIVLRKSAWAFSARKRPRARAWPKALSVASPCTESSSSAP